MAHKNRVPVSRHLCFVVIAALGLIADLASKHWIFNKLSYPPRRDNVLWIWQDYFGFELSLNEGALFGIGQGMVPVFVVLSVAAAIGIVAWLFIAGAAEDRWLTFALALIMAGIFGNLWDRLGLHGLVWWGGMDSHGAGEPVYAVRDWILFQYGEYRWPNFNLADSYLVCGVIMILIGSWRQVEEDTEAETPQSGQSATPEKR